MFYIWTSSSSWHLDTLSSSLKPTWFFLSKCEKLQTYVMTKCNNIFEHTKKVFPEDFAISAETRSRRCDNYTCVFIVCVFCWWIKDIIYRLLISLKYQLKLLCRVQFCCEFYTLLCGYVLFKFSLFLIQEVVYWSVQFCLPLESSMSQRDQVDVFTHYLICTLILSSNQRLRAPKLSFLYTCVLKFRNLSKFFSVCPTYNVLSFRTLSSSFLRGPNDKISGNQLVHLGCNRMYRRWPFSPIRLWYTDLPVLANFYA